MSTAESAHGGVGIVRVGDLEITVTPLTIVEERALARVLRDEAEAAAGDYFTRCARLHAAMKKVDREAYLESVREITRIVATGATVSEQQLWEYRAGPAGLARELYHRGRKATPGLTLDGLRAVVTAENLDEVGAQLVAVLESADPNAPTP